MQIGRVTVNEGRGRPAAPEMQATDDKP